MNLKKSILALSILSISSLPALAGYTITRTDGGNNTRLVQGREYEYLISNTNTPIRLEDVFIDLSSPNYDILVAPGVQTGPNKYSVDGSGQLVISIRFHNPGSYSMTVRNSQDSNNRGTLNGIQVQRYPVTFSITPSNPTVNADVLFLIDVTALDTNGLVVTAYEDAVQIRDSQLGSLVGFVNGSDFVNGTATNVPVRVKAGNLSNQFRLTLTGELQYYDPGLPAPSLSANPSLISNLLNLIPGPFYKLVMLFPGETLNPGNGKSGTVLDQQSGVPVSLVTVRRVDQFFNPLLANPNPAINVQFTSSQVGQDNPPFPFTLSMTSPLLSISAAMNQIYFGGSGDRIVKAIPDGDTSKEDSSLVPATPGAAESYTIEIVGVAPNQTIDTETLMLVRIRAFDQNGDPLSTLFGQVPGAELRAQLGNSQESRAWVDTNEPTLIPDNVINFNAGVATMNLVVTKFGSDVKLHYVTPNREAFSIPFNVDVGAPNKVHFTIRGKAPNPTQGETWTPGTYPGNSGVPPVVKVGEEVVVEARITDRRWNLISGGGANYTMQITNTINHFIEARHMTLSGPTYQFPNNGEFAYSNDPAFDRSFRVKFRTAGPSASPVIPAPQFQGTISLGTFQSSTSTVVPEIYSKLVIAVPGETLRPGIDTETDGKTGTPAAQQAGVQFNAVAYATDLYFNPVLNGPFPTVNFTLTPSLAASFVSGALPAAMQSGQRTFSITLASGTAVRLFDNATPAIFQQTSVPIMHGPLDHFRMTLNALGDKEAGVPFSATVRAEDQYNNVVLSFNQAVTLTPNTGAGTMTPTTLNLVNGSLTIDLTMFASTQTARIQMSLGSVISQSPTFVVRVNSQGYKRLLLLLPGELIAQGTANGKIGTPTPVTVGLVNIARAIACDLYYNPIDTAGTVIFASNHLAQFGAAQGSLANVDGHGEYATTLILKNATTHTITLQDVNLGASVSSSSSTIQGLVGTYKKLQILLPGETSDPDQTNGKAGAPIAQKVATPFTVTMRAVDDFWNLVNFTGGDTHLSASITASIFNPPNNNGGVSPRPFTNGVATRQAIIGQQGLTTLTVRDDANLTKPGQSVDVQVDPGPIYVFTTQPTAVAGQAFPTVTIRLEENGVPVNGYNRSIYLTADLTSGGPASGAFNPDGSPREYVMSNGEVTINDLSYAYVENIKIHLEDEFGRVGFSDPIDVVPSGLKYKVTVPSSEVIAGPPSSFPVKVELIEQNTNTAVKNHDHSVTVEIISAVSPTTNGAFTVTTANLVQGVANFQQSYTKAESVIIRISEDPTNGEPTYVIPSQNSNNVNVIADGNKKLLVVVPGETHVPGVASATGKTGAPSPRQKGVPFLVQVRGVDQYWNVAQNFSGGKVRFESNDLPPSITLTNPTNQDAPLVNGESASFIHLDNPGTVSLTVKDADNPLIGVQSVLINVGGLYYQIDGIPAQVAAGPPTQFTMNVTLYDSITNLPVTNANQSVTIEARLPNGQPASGTLGVTSAQLSNGTVGLTNQSYSIAENVFLYVKDSIGNTGSSAVINFIPRQVRYVFETPADAEVNTPFQVIVRTIDQDTGTEVKNLNRTNTIAAMSGTTGLPANGVFVPGTVNIVGGVGTMSATYNLAEPIFLLMTDSTPIGGQSPPTQPTFSSQGVITVHPGALAAIDGIADFAMQSNETRSFTITARDTFGNIIPTQKLSIRVNGIDEGQISINGEINSYTGIMNSAGQMNVLFDPSIDANGLIEIVLSDADRPNGYSKLITIDMFGLSRGRARAREIGDNKIPINSAVKLDITVRASAGGTVRTFYRVDGGPWQTYDPAVGATGFDQTKQYSIEWYSEVCSDLACTNPISELAISGAPNFISVTAYIVTDQLNGYPSPFNPKATNGENYLTIQYPLTTATSVEIDIYDLFGQKIWHKDINAGDQGGEARADNRVFWLGVNDEGHTVANGGYIVTVKPGGTGQTMKTKVLVVK